ncbi:SchA/CurD-like domain-containing protein [Streptomyces althioticus]|uniref:SchA/CurD-like domain-containing protein n=1 Tax=Streptomyces TaxID=1883 RepID=UPI000526606F|nr:SchA/CurD-like domain-containing protein [Actinospica acidiphila]ALV48801.1 protein in whiE locus [Streptomyces sp. 4F]WTC26665.1 antibiotic biosynthesis monooxygenase [Streptomyces althioticus]
MTMSGRISQSAFDGSRLRVILLLDLYEGAQEQFLEAYEHMRNAVASVPGHISDQLCQSIENPSQWLITSEWESAPPFLAWVNSEEHVETVRPMHSCVRDTRSMRYSVVRETFPEQPLAPGAAAAGLQSEVRVGDGVARHALTFTVKPGSESKVAELLAGYESPKAQVDDTTRLRRTSLFMHGNRVVRAVEVEGDLLAALRHVARQPEVRAVEEAINPYLEQDRDLTDPESARLFFTRAALPAVHHVTAGRPEPQGLRRHALYYPAVQGRGMDLARFLAHQDEAAAGDPDSPVHASTVFQRDDIVVRLVDVTGDLDLDPLAALGIKGPGKAAELRRLLDGAAIGVEGDLDSERTLNRLLSHADMLPVTDRSAAAS